MLGTVEDRQEMPGRGENRRDQGGIGEIAVPHGAGRLNVKSTGSAPHFNTSDSPLCLCSGGGWAEGHGQWNCMIWEPRESGWRTMQAPAPPDSPEGHGFQVL